MARERAGLIRKALRLPYTKHRNPWVGRWDHIRTSCPPSWEHLGGRDVERAILSHFLFCFFFVSLSISPHDLLLSFLFFWFRLLTHLIFLLLFFQFSLQKKGPRLLWVLLISRWPMDQQHHLTDLDRNMVFQPSPNRICILTR